MEHKIELLKSIKTVPTERLHQVRTYLSTVLSDMSNVYDDECWTENRKKRKSDIREIISITDEELIDRMLGGEL